MGKNQTFRLEPVWEDICEMKEKEPLAEKMALPVLGKINGFRAIEFRPLANKNPHSSFHKEVFSVAKFVRP